ncbi:SAM-dependent methyltransferase [Oribacterium sp. C9]|uniref:tRNA1(Val) (adenine(37)-N6)-methyltransferase n=1 Tax=Oribacterium sp. C9 TaxID=1943579 RepID=UPI0009901E4B|nr:tRNA1(Val) (adenine(37)-N6)-methyltransferase [Oribacterium sp. C9]OON86455.1 SAM-dependent methyltransferase [Oribacterium sp. C9]
MAERIDDLQCNGYKIIQDTDGFCFGMDAVLLANYALAAVNDETRLLDLCSGTGIVPLLIAAKTGCRELTGIELQKDVADMAERSVKLNQQENRMRIIQGDLREIKELGLDSSMNVVTCNPPYMNAGLKNATDRKLISRHEVMCTLADVCYAAAYTLKSNGKFFMVHRPNRLVDIFNELRKVHLEPKRMRLVYPYENSEANMVLLEAVKGGKTQLTVEKPLVVYKDKNIYTDEIVSIYAVS